MARLPDLGGMPPIGGIDRWLNTDAPLTKDDFLGKVVLLEFMTGSCINCIHTFPTLARWHEAYGPQGLLVLGVHTPEFAYEREEKAVTRALKDHGLTFPVAMDNDYVTWRNFNNRYWPATYLFDAEGRLRFTHVGEGDYQEIEAAVRSLLREAGAAFERGRLAKDEETDPELAGEAYLGYAKPGDLASPEKVRRDDIQTYSVPDGLEPGRPALQGRWRVEGERAVAASEGAALVLRFDAKEVAAVIAPPDASSATCRVRVDGMPPGRRIRGADLVERGGETYVVIDRPRTYRLLSGRRTEGRLEIACLNRGTSVYNVTFG